MSSVDSRKFVGASFGLSISDPPADDPDWPRYYGNPVAVVNQFVFNEGSNFLFEGGTLVFGHRWDGTKLNEESRGILDHLILKCREFRVFRPVEAEPGGGIPPSIINFLAWPDRLPAGDDSEAQRLMKEGLLSIEPVFPDGIEAELLEELREEKQGPEKMAEALRSPLGVFARVRALSAMRRKLAERSDYRICIGGAYADPDRRISGVIEEALVTCGLEKPLYVSGAFGGASKALADCLLQRHPKENFGRYFHTPAPAVAIMEGFAEKYALPEQEGPSLPKGWDAYEWFQQQSLEKIAERAGLSVDEYIQILAPRDVETAMGWVLTGIRNLRSR